MRHDRHLTRLGMRARAATAAPRNRYYWAADWFRARRRWLLVIQSQVTVGVSWSSLTSAVEASASVGSSAARTCRGYRASAFVAGLGNPVQERSAGMDLAQARSMPVTPSVTQPDFICCPLRR